MEALRMDLARGIETRRCRLGVTVSRLAGEAGCSRATINKVLAGKVGVRLRTLAGIAIACECDAWQLWIDDAHVAPPTTRLARVDLVCVLARNVSTMSRRRGFGNIESLARAAGISKSQLYVIIDVKSDACIDRVGELALPLSCAPHELLRPHAQHFPEV
jgi:DNA-binding Xre family transcriptional regulator